MTTNKLKTMKETYGDASNHLCCPNCGACIDCGDCDCELRQEWIKGGYMNLNENKKIK